MRLPISIVRECIDKKTLDEFINLISSDESFFKTNEHDNRAESRDFMSCKNDRINEIFQNISNSLFSVTKTTIGKEIYRKISPVVLRYGIGQKISNHKDWDPDNQPYAWTKVDLACIYYINDDYLGGDFNIIDGPEKENQKVILSYKPVANSCVIIDGDTYHGTTEVSGGFKYCMTLFFSFCPCDKCDKSCYGRGNE